MLVFIVIGPGTTAAVSKAYDVQLSQRASMTKQGQLQPTRKYTNTVYNATSMQQAACQLTLTRAAPSETLNAGIWVG